MTLRIAAAAVLIAVWTCAAAVAQPPAAPPNPFQPLSAKAALTDEDRAAIRKLVAERVEQIKSGSRREAVAELRDAYAGASPAFREAYTAICIELITAAYKQAEPGPAAQLVVLLTTFNEVPTYRLFVEALRDERVGVRASAAIGLRALRAGIARTGNVPFNEVVEALREAGKRETSAVTLKTIYQALNYPEVVPSPPDPKADASAVLEILEARAKPYAEAKAKAEAAGADVVGLSVARGLSKQLSDADRNRLLEAAAMMLRWALARYTTELYKIPDTANPYLLRERNDAELLIEEGEALLASVLAPSGKRPNVTEALQKKSKPEEIRGVWGEWVKLLANAVGKDFSLPE